MIRKTLYALLGITLVLVINQIVVPGEGSIVSGGTTATATNTATASGIRGTLEVRLSATGSAEGVDSLTATVSSVEIHLPTGWSKMTPAGSDRAELVALTGSEQTLATAELSQGTYTQIRLTFSRADAVLSGGQGLRAELKDARVTFSQNFTITARNPTVLVVNVDMERSVSLNGDKKATFRPFVSLLYTRSPGSMEITTTSPPNGAAGSPYETMLVAIGGQRPYSWSITMGDLPDGLSLDAATGIISGAPTRAGFFGFTARVDDSSPTRKNASRNFTLTISHEGELQILSGSLPDGAENKDYATRLEATGGSQPYHWEIVSGKLPAGLGLDVASGAISGKPAARGDFNFTVRLTDGTASDSQDLVLHIAQAWSVN